MGRGLGRSQACRRKATLEAGVPRLGPGGGALGNRKEMFPPPPELRPVKVRLQQRACRGPGAVGARSRAAD